MSNVTKDIFTEMYTKSIDRFRPNLNGIDKYRTIVPNFGGPVAYANNDRHERLLRCKGCRLKYEKHLLIQFATHLVCKFCMKDLEKNVGGNSVQDN